MTQVEINKQLDEQVARVDKERREEVRFMYFLYPPSHRALVLVRREGSSHSR